MSTINQIIYDLAYRAGSPDDHTLRERLKVIFFEILDERLRQDITKNGVSNQYKTRSVLPLSKVDKLDDCNVTVNCTILRTTSKIIMPVRVKGRTPFTYTGTPTGKVITYINFADLEDFSKLRYIGNEAYYTFGNGYIYVFNINKLKNIVTEQISSNQELLSLCSSDASDCYDNDSELLIPNDMIANIKKQIIVEVLKLGNSENIVEMDK